MVRVLPEGERGIYIHSTVRRNPYYIYLYVLVGLPPWGYMITYILVQAHSTLYYSLMVGTVTFSCVLAAYVIHMLLYTINIKYP